MGNYYYHFTISNDINNINDLPATKEPEIIEEQFIMTNG